MIHLIFKLFKNPCAETSELLEGYPSSGIWVELFMLCIRIPKFYYSSNSQRQDLSRNIITVIIYPGAGPHCDNNGVHITNKHNGKISFFYTLKVILILKHFYA
ncbi:hypothetical protein NERG_01341 [Nematocida ausubeli]|uniref:Uncharacterized protein n=1 Tax=Nematocida ausubeli (strain ATCC PRA-371 / ERTm2) TaxID=1913371 RepID=H8ZC98_NEMA1|nr:hypothetical protein NERG_01341 [Nematocida ausubeli]